MEYELIRIYFVPISLPCETLTKKFAFNSPIFGRAVRNEHLTLIIYSTVFGGIYLATRGGAKTVKPTTVQQAKESVLLKADSS